MSPREEPDAAAVEVEDEDGRIGIFPSWRALYFSVLIYTMALIALLYVLTRLLDKSVA